MVAAPQAVLTFSGKPEEEIMSIARVTEISATSTESFDDAVRQGVARAAQTLRNVSGAWIKEMQVDVTDGAVSRFRVNMMVTFVLDDD